MPRTLRYPQAVPTKLQVGDVYIKQDNKVKIVGEDGLWYDWDPQIDPPIQSPLTPVPVADRPPATVPMPINPPPSGGDVAIRTGLRVGGDIGGRILGGTLGGLLGAGETATGVGVVAAPATIYAGYKAGGAIGSGLGEYLAEQHEIAAGDRESVNPWQVGGQTALGLIDLPGLKSLDKLPPVKAALAKGGAYAAQAVGLGVPAAAASQLTDDLYYRYGTPEEQKQRAIEAGKMALKPAALLGTVAGVASAAPRLAQASRVNTVRKAYKGAVGFATDPANPTQTFIVREVEGKVKGAEPVLVPTPLDASRLPLVKQAFPELGDVPLPQKATPTTPANLNVYGESAGPAPRHRVVPPTQTGAVIPPELVPPATAPLRFEAADVPVPERTPPPPPNFLTNRVVPEVAGGLGGAAIGAVTGAVTTDEDDPLSTTARTLLGAVAGAGVGAGTVSLARRAPARIFKGTAAELADAQTPNRIGADRATYTQRPREPMVKTIARLPKTLWDYGNSLVDRDFDLTTNPGFFATARQAFGEVRSQIGSIPHKALRVVMAVAKPKGLADQLTNADLFAYGEMRKQAGIVFDYERQAARNVLRQQEGLPTEPIKLEGLEGAPADQITAAYQAAHHFAETTWANMKPAVQAFHQRVVDYFDRLGQERVAMGGVSQQTVDALKNDPRPWLRYWPAYAIDEDGGIRGYYYGGAHPGRPESLGRNVFREGRTEKTLDDPIEVIYRYTAAHEADKLHHGFMEELATKFDPTRYNPKVNINDQATWPQGYVEYVTPSGRLAASHTDELTDITTPNQRERYLLPAEIARNLNRMEAHLNPRWGAAINALHRWNSLHRAAILHPLSVGAVYDVTNFIGDGIITAMGTELGRLPALTKGTYQAAIGRFFDEPTQQKFDQYAPSIGLGGAQAEMTEQAMRHPFIAATRPPVVRAADETNLNFLARKFVRGIDVARTSPEYWVSEARRYREGIFRMGKMFERLDAGLPPEEASAVTRHLLVDYDSLSPEESRYIKGILFPFWTYAARTFQKLTPGLARDPLTGSKADGAFGALSLQSKGAFGHLALMSWNEAMFPEAEHALDDYQRQMPHAIVPVGVFEDGALELATIFFGGREIIEKGLTDLPTAGPALRLMQWTINQAAKMEKADYKPENGVRFAWLGYPSPRSIAGHMVGVGGAEQKAFDYAAKYENSPLPTGEAAAKQAYDTWGGMLSSVVTIPALFGAPAIGLRSTDIRGRRVGVGEGLPFFPPDSWNALASGTNIGEKVKAGLRQTPGVSLYLRGVQASDEGDWFDLGVKSIIGSMIRLDKGKDAPLYKRPQILAKAIDEASDANTAEDRRLSQTQVVAGWLTSKEGRQLVLGPAAFSGPEGPAKFGVVWQSVGEIDDKSAAETIRAHLTRVAKTQSFAGGDQQQAWKALYADTHGTQMGSHMNFEAKDRAVRAMARPRSRYSLDFFDRLMTPYTEPQTRFEATADLNEATASETFEEWLAKLKAKQQQAEPPAPVTTAPTSR